MLYQKEKKDDRDNITREIKFKRSIRKMVKMIDGMCEIELFMAQWLHWVIFSAKKRISEINNKIAYF